MRRLSFTELDDYLTSNQYHGVNIAKGTKIMFSNAKGKVVTTIDQAQVLTTSVFHHFIVAIDMTNYLWINAEELPYVSFTEE